MRVEGTTFFRQPTKARFGIMPKDKDGAVLQIFADDFRMGKAKSITGTPRVYPTDKLLKRIEETLRRTNGLMIFENKNNVFTQTQLRQLSLAIGEALAKKDSLASVVKALARNPFNPNQRYPRLPVGGLFLRAVFDPLRASAESRSVPASRKPNVVIHSTHGHFDPILGQNNGEIYGPQKGYLMVGIFDGELPHWFPKKDTEATRYVTDSIELLNKRFNGTFPPDFGDYGRYLEDDEIAEFSIPVDRSNGSIIFHTLPFMHHVGPDSTGGTEGAPYGFLGISKPDAEKHREQLTDRPLLYNSSKRGRRRFLRGEGTR